MSPLPVLTLTLTLTLSSALGLTRAVPSVRASDRGLRDVTAHELTIACETSLPHMREAMTTLRQGGSLTQQQEAVWRVWNRDCRQASWQQALAENRLAHTASPTAPFSADDTTTACTGYLPHMQKIVAAQRQGHRLTESDRALWQVWTKRCNQPAWQQALGTRLPPVPAPPVPAPPPPPTPPSTPTWREYVYAGLKGLERGFSAPIVYCRSNTSVKRGKAYTYSYCY